MLTPGENDVTYVLHLSYDGTNYLGWQKQPNAPTVQGTVENIICLIFDRPIRTVGASRTDAGVHAEDQVVSFSAVQKFSPDDLSLRLNKMLPEDISVNHVRIASGDFNARYSAKGKRYRYVLLLRKNPLRMRYGYWMRGFVLADTAEELDAISKKIIGTHNFAAFSIASDIPDDPNCRVTDAKWEKIEDELHFYIEADRFLHKMIRSLVGAIIDVYRHRIDIDDLEKMLTTGERICEFQTVPACGLTLMKVFY